MSDTKKRLAELKKTIGEVMVTEAFKKIRIGMIGGGPNAFIGEVHRLAARLDNRFELVSGCFSADYLKSKKFGIGLGLDSERIYRTPSEMASAEATTTINLLVRTLDVIITKPT